MVIRDGGVMDKKIRGIIINEYPFEDTSKIINIFTSDGIVGVLAKGAKRIKSPFFGSTTRFSYGEFDINYKDNGLSILKDASIINNYSKIKKDIVNIESGSMDGVYDISLRTLVNLWNKLSTSDYNFGNELLTRMILRVNKNYEMLKDRRW